MKTIKIYSKSHCPYCTSAKNLLSAKGVSYKEIDAEKYEDEFFSLAEKYNHKTVPMIFIGDNFIGGFDNLKSLQEAGKLDNILK